VGLMISIPWFVLLFVAISGYIIGEIIGYEKGLKGDDI